MAPREEFYRWIKIAGMLSFIPFILVAGAMAGYFTGDFLERKFGLGSFAMALCITIGMLASIVEAVRIIKLALKLEKKV